MEKKISCDVNLETVFGEKACPISVYLCRAHPVELFRSGQRKFLNKYGYITRIFIGFPEQKFFSLMYRISRTDIRKD
jgi:hypothetical protein